MPQNKAGRLKCVRGGIANAGIIDIVEFSIRLRSLLKKVKIFENFK